MATFIFAFFVLFTDGSRIDVRYVSFVKQDCEAVGGNLHFQFSHNVNAQMTKGIRITNRCEDAS